MQSIPLGNSDLSIGPIVFGGNVFGWTADPATSFRLLDTCLEQGITMIDTADMYSTWVPGHQGGESESIIGDWLKQSGKRQQVVLATKVGMPMPQGGGLSRQHIIASVEASLKRLKTDHIDLYYAHKDDESVPFEETFGAFQQLIDAGKVRAIASSNYSAPRLRQALEFTRDNKLSGYVAHQPEYNLFDRFAYEGELEATCQEFGLGVVTYFSLASGFLSGKYRSEADLKGASRAQFLGKYMTPRGLRILEALNSVARQHQAPVAAVALAWIMHRPSVSAPIVSATSVQQLEQLCQSAHLALTADDMNLLNKASQP